MLFYARSTDYFSYFFVADYMNNTLNLSFYVITSLYFRVIVISNKAGIEVMCLSSYLIYKLLLLRNKYKDSCFENLR